MWTEEKLKEAAREWVRDFSEDFDVMIGVRWNLRAAFLAGCEYIINNTQKDGKTE